MGGRGKKASSGAAAAPPSETTPLPSVTDQDTYTAAMDVVPDRRQAVAQDRADSLFRFKPRLFPFRVVADGGWEMGRGKTMALAEGHLKQITRQVTNRGYDASSLRIVEVR